MKSCDGCFLYLLISLVILAKMLLSLVFWNWLAVMPRRSIFAVLVRWLGISWAVAADSVSPAVHDLFQVIDARTMPQLALTEQPTCDFLG